MRFLCAAASYTWSHDAIVSDPPSTPLLRSQNKTSLCGCWAVAPRLGTAVFSEQFNTCVVCATDVEQRAKLCSSVFGWMCVLSPVPEHWHRGGNMWEQCSCALCGAV